MNRSNTDDRYKELATKWLNNTITPEEQSEFAAWYNADQDLPIEIPLSFAENDEELKARILDKINAGIKKDNSGKTALLKWLSIAASFLLLSALGTVYIITTKTPKPITIAHYARQPKNDAIPGSNKAVLTLSSGAKIDLTDVKKGVLANQGKTLLKKSKDGQVVYEGAANSAGANDSSVVYNTITVPKGGQFQVVLSDGSKVWLNSASSITFPTAFSKIERKVNITGEVYFEVAKNKHLPFRVTAGKQIVEVLGTHFNINAYSDEPSIKTTLIEGSVKVSANTQSAFLKPEEQSTILNSSSSKITVNTVDVDDVLAWKNGNFQFEKVEIPVILREAARWYDVNVKYEGEMPQKRFTGSISRSVNLSELLKMLKYTGINFEIEGKTIVVTS